MGRLAAATDNAMWTIKAGPPHMHGKVIQLITPEVFKQLPPGTKLFSIMGEEVEKGKDYIDDDTRGGYLAYGVE